MQRTKRSGLLAIWNDCNTDQYAAYEAWYIDEHLPERLAIPGFCEGRRYEAIDAPRRFLTTYDVECPAILTSKAYLARLDHPTPLTQRMMRDAFRNMSRTLCQRYPIGGRCRGAVILTAVSKAEHPLASLQFLAERLPQSLDKVHEEIWISVEKGEAIQSEEEALRGEDDKITGCLALEFMRETSAREIAEFIRQVEPGMDVGIYRLLCSLRNQGEV